MQLPFFYEEVLPERVENFELSPETSRHVSQVLRMKAGDQIILTDGKGIELVANIVKPDKRHTEVAFDNRRHFLSPENNNAIGISLLKSESRFEWFLEKATELGIRRIIPFLSARSEKQHFRRQRMHNVLVSAMLQSRQYFLPELSDAVSLAELFNDQQYDQKFLAHCYSELDRTPFAPLVDKDRPALVLIGPEGDFTEKEVQEGVDNGFLPVTLGTTRLRTETAALVAAVHLAN